MAKPDYVLLRDGAQWPPHCCVPAFVHAALEIFGIPFEAPFTLPTLLGVRVGPADSNPLALPVAAPGEVCGVTASEAERSINRLFHDLELPLHFRHVPFNEITLRLYDDVLRCALDRELVVGLGLDYSQLVTPKGKSGTLHVLRVLTMANNQLLLFDDSHECRPPQFSCSWDEVERTVLAVPDGYWLIGSSANLALAYTLPWSHERVI